MPNSLANAEGQDELIEPEKTRLRIMRNNPACRGFAPRSHLFRLEPPLPIGLRPAGTFLRELAQFPPLSESLLSPAEILKLRN